MDFMFDEDGGLGAVDGDIGGVAQRMGRTAGTEAILIEPFDLGIERLTRGNIGKGLAIGSRLSK